MTFYFPSKAPCSLWKNIHFADNYLMYQPCSVVALNCALKDMGLGSEEWLDDFATYIQPKENGYVSLNDFHKAIKHFFPNAKKIYFPKKDRETLVENQAQYGAFTNRKAIVCCLGHYIYVNHNTYYSYFNNDDDLVVAIWFLD